MSRAAAALAATVLAAASALTAGCLEPPRRPDAGVPDTGLTPCLPSPDSDPDAGTACEPDQTCQFATSTSFGCVPAGDAGDHAPCRTDRCTHGFFCATPPGAEQPVCLGLCRQDADCPQDAGMEMCALALHQGGPATLCQRFTPCEPLVTPSSCSYWQKCSLWRLPGPYVCMDPGTRGDYAPCDGESDCAPGYACVRYGQNPSLCVRFCATDDDCPQAGGLELCLRRNYPERPPIFCERVQPCSPDEQACPAGQSCYPYQHTGKNLTDVQGLCRTTGTGAAGSPCSYLNDCAAGLACLEAYPGQHTCRAICSLDQTLPCPTGSCMAINTRFGACY